MGRMFLTNKEAAKIHGAAIKILGETGIKLDHYDTEKMLLEAGANRDKGGRVLIPSFLVQRALWFPKREFILYDRTGGKGLAIEDGKTFFGSGSDAMYFVDENREIVTSKLEHLRYMVSLTDALENFDFVMSMSLPEEVHFSAKKLYATVFAEMVKNTSKPLVVTAAAANDIRQMYDIALIVKGSEKALRDEPFFLAYLEPISPLEFNYDAVDKLLFCVDQDIPFCFAAGANAGSGAPSTLVGAIAQGVAESLAGLVIAFVRGQEEKRLKFIFGANTSVVDMRTGALISYGAVEWSKTVAMYADLGSYFNLPSWGTAGCTDSFRKDLQAGVETYEGILTALQSGSTMVHDMGFMGHGEVYDPRLLVWLNAMVGRAKYLLRPAKINRNTLATDVIDRVARDPRAVFLADQHTFENFQKELWLPPAFIDRRYTNDALSSNIDRLTKILETEAEKIMGEHESVSLPQEITKEIDDYLEDITED